MSFRFGIAVGTPGMAELGPLVGDSDLPRALQPLYDAGAAHALELALAGEAGDHSRPRRGVPRSKAPLPSPVPAVEEPPARPPAPPRARAPVEHELTPVELAERLVDAVAEAEDGLSVDELVDVLGLSDRVLARELLELERMGLLSAVDGGRGRRYHLG
jgi:hypothetical protein